MMHDWKRRKEVKDELVPRYEGQPKMRNTTHLDLTTKYNA